MPDAATSTPGRLHARLRIAPAVLAGPGGGNHSDPKIAPPHLMHAAPSADAGQVTSSLHESLLEQRLPGPARDQALNNLAVVRMWWTVLESEWRSMFINAEDEDATGQSMVDPRLRAAVAHFQQFEAEVDDLMASGDHVVVSLSLSGRIGGTDVSAREAWVCRLEEGAVTHVRHHSTLQEAIASIAPPAAPTVARPGD